MLDTNVFIHAQDYAQRDHEAGEVAAEVLQAIGELGYTPVIAQGTLDELARSGEFRDARTREAERYARLVPGPPGDLRQRAGYGEVPGVNDECDLRILAALDQGLAAWLITNDKRMIGHATQAGLTHVLDARQFLEFLDPARHPLEPPPQVETVPPARVNIGSPFFSSLVGSYPEFGDWWTGKVIPQGRATLVVGDPEDPLALAVLKEEDVDYGLPSDTTKICTFKVSGDARGQRYGELLLKAAFQCIRAVPSSTAFLEVTEGNELVEWLERFGFEVLPGRRAANGDLVMVKHLTAGGRRRGIDPWTYHKTYGPGALRVGKAFLVPIRPGWHERLFPSPEAVQPSLLAEFTEPCGNAITKVYISRTRSRQPSRGDVLVFVESQTGWRVSNLGVVEEVLVSQDPIEVLRFAGSRTVYTPQEVNSLCSKGEVHVMKFRHDRTLTEPWKPGTPGYDALVSRPPQSVTAVRKEGLEWLRQQVGG
ncbi:PIN domain-containing protein [Actinomyces timonensis]|uniref:PIN domain-containing protein n=1 Tax=Actinomyces timonensis TaxID=1288391 RepID=UPI00036FD085|nr:PIN domain-containing protein [Actinomyces timonensis]